MGLDRLKSVVGGGRGRLSREQFDKSRPIRNELVDQEPCATGLLLRAPLQSQGTGMLGLLAKWAKMPDTKEFELEEVGAFVWQLCDGDHTTEGIARKLRERFKMNRLEAETALGAFLETLARRRLITLTLPKKK